MDRVTPEWVSQLESPPGTQHWVLVLMGLPGEGKVLWVTLPEHFAQSEGQGG